MMRAELDALICSGARRGKQFTYALLEERTPGARTLDRDDALAKLAKRYFSSHGPATLRDYAWWSGTAREAKTGIEMTRSLAQDVMDGRTYWFVPSKAGARPASPSVHLLPNYDEYLIAYKDRGSVRAGSMAARVAAAAEFAHHLVIDGRLRGSWRRTLTAVTATIEVRPFRPLDADERHALEAEAARYGKFVDMRVTLSVT
jgi:hypothetical protein